MGAKSERAFSTTHKVLKTRLEEPFPEGTEKIMFGMGCFWGAEKRFWEVPGVYSTQVGYSGGSLTNPSYEQVCTGRTGHAEVVRVIYYPSEVPFEHLLKVFWEEHDSTQGNGQGNDIGPQYRSAIYTYNQEQYNTAISSMKKFQEALNEKGYGKIKTEIAPAGEFYPAEDYHQQYLAKTIFGYCGLRRTGCIYNCE
eukprot:CAMPEP_0202427814 /NCGR_PEP_ID=MMETSP1345-20130828/1960_1 /ASSEMBLY_ACC=CAM_ASM_000843 /TAXON_ID=342563 /ORGANISM="Fabrea Fabrea salina" /LENGTH=195 /DNA_ID=CAMNT_0049038631 /DNA_START=1424 /DNA_END=2011 /DNA_ORIENTATION=+